MQQYDEEWPSEQEDNQELDVFNKLAPPTEEKVIHLKKTNLAWMKKQDNNKGNKQNKKQAKNTKNQARSRSRQRSRSRDRELRFPKEQEKIENCIVISDDEEQGDVFKSQFMSMNWRERRKLDRIFERQQRNYRLGKQKDSLSFTVFNTIESYFR